jgi:hypothetical protein
MYLVKLVTQPTELQQIAALSKQNLRNYLPEEEKQAEGFITWEYSFELLEQLHAIAPSVIVTHQQEVVGYALTAFTTAAAFQPEMVPMIGHLEPLLFKGKRVREYRYYIMGQVCIAKTHRGKGVFGMLYQHHREIYQPQFDLLVTEVSTSNLRSLQAHKQMGFQTIDTYSDELDEWDVVVWDWE